MEGQTGSSSGRVGGEIAEAGAGRRSQHPPPPPLLLLVALTHPPSASGGPYPPPLYFWWPLPQVEASWPDSRKADYIRHTIREFDIHKQLRHRRIAQFLDVFEIDANTFATVMELCEGGDLDQRLRIYGEIGGRGGEREKG